MASIRGIAAIEMKGNGRKDGAGRLDSAYRSGVNFL